jgi:hypothetical protein
MLYFFQRFGVRCIFMINGTGYESRPIYRSFEILDWNALLKFGICLLLWSTAKLSLSQDYTSHENLLRIG